MMQLIDCSIADIQSFQYKPKLLACSFLYLVIGNIYCKCRKRAWRVSTKEDRNLVSKYFALFA
jgi:hypothetical protein